MVYAVYHPHFHSFSSIWFLYKSLAKFGTNPIINQTLSPINQISVALENTDIDLESCMGFIVLLIKFYFYSICVLHLEPF